jgi:alkanesulfonate monooxygenase SsuD/methylene tetrahydromethanopterin reductase-like flavin-dependent oxidoreductase (luciferase family)
MTLRESIQLPVNDPPLRVLAMAAVTQHLGVVTANLTLRATLPAGTALFDAGRSHARAQRWNVVTGCLDSAARAMGLAEQIAHDTTSATTGPTTTSRCFTSCGKAAGKTARCGMAHES